MPRYLIGYSATIEIVAEDADTAADMAWERRREVGEGLEVEFVEKMR